MEQYTKQLHQYIISTIISFLFTVQCGPAHGQHNFQGHIPTHALTLVSATRTEAKIPTV